MHKYTNIIAALWVGLGLMMLLSTEIKAQNIAVEYQSFDGENSLLFGCDYQEPVTRMYINVLNVTGGSGNYTISTTGETDVSSTNITSGQGFTFYFTEQDQRDETIDFTISDGSGKSYSLEFQIYTQIQLLQFAVCTSQSNVCRNNVEHMDMTVPVTVYRTANYIKSNSVILSPSTTTTYFSENFVELQSGFEVPLKTGFLADIRNCTP